MYQGSVGGWETRKLIQNWAVEGDLPTPRDQIKHPDRVQWVPCGARGGVDDDQGTALPISRRHDLPSHIPSPQYQTQLIVLAFGSHSRTCGQFYPLYYEGEVNGYWSYFLLLGEFFFSFFFLFYGSNSREYRWMSMMICRMDLRDTQPKNTYKIWYKFDLIIIFKLNYLN